LRFEHYVDDAAGWVSQLSRDTRFMKTALIGHSEGALVGLLAARRAPTAAYVSIAGPGERASLLMLLQLAGHLPPDLSAAAEKPLEALEAGAIMPEVPPPLAALFRPSVQPYLISWFKVSPADEIAALKAPCLLLQGTTDLQVQVTDAQALKTAQPDCQLSLVPSMNHVLKTVPADQARLLAAYTDPTLPVAPEPVRTITSFLQLRTDPHGRALPPPSLVPAEAHPGPVLARAQAGPLRVTLGLTDNETALRREWETAAASPRLQLIDRARAGDKVTTVVVFEGCAVASAGSCRLAAQFELLLPDGKPVAAGSGVLWSSPPLSGRLMLGAASATIPIGPTWPHGHYAVRVTVTDDVSRQALTLVARFTVDP
jgi:Alpha/beta hydrolase family